MKTQREAPDLEKREKKYQGWFLKRSDVSTKSLRLCESVWVMEAQNRWGSFPSNITV